MKLIHYIKLTILLLTFKIYLCRAHFCEEMHFSVIYWNICKTVFLKLRERNRHPKVFWNINSEITSDWKKEIFRLCFMRVVTKNWATTLRKPAISFLIETSKSFPFHESRTYIKISKNWSLEPQGSSLNFTSNIRRT